MKQKDKKYLIVIPAHNEAENIGMVIDEVREYLPFADIIVINDHSTDDTYNTVINMGIKCISLPVNTGYSTAVQTGIIYAEKEGYDYVIQFDGDGQHMAEQAGKIIDFAEESKADIVIGSRYLLNKGYKQSFFRKIGTKLFSWIIKLSTGKRITDPTSGFQVLSKNVIKSYSHMDGFPEYPDANLIIDMFKKGYVIDEIPVKMRQRMAGESMHDGIIGPIKYMVIVTYAVILILFRRKGLQ